MHDDLIRTISSVAGGALGGVLGTAVMQQGMGLSKKLPEPLQMPEMKQDPGDFMVKKAEEKLGAPFDDETHGKYAHGLHWAYGTSWGTLAGIAAPLLGIRSVKDAALLGAGVGALSWGAGFLGWLPATGITKPIHRERFSKTAMSLASHVLFGVVSVVPVFLAGKLFAPKRRLFGLI